MIHIWKTTSIYHKILNLIISWELVDSPECLWVYEVENFGPLTITIDIHGGNLTEESIKNIAKNKEKILKEL